LVRILSVGIVPSFFTMANMFCGYFAIILATGGKFTQAAWLIITAAVLDALDGKLARMTKSSSDFGVQYDSLADVISFGLAPSFLVYKVYFQGWGTIGLFVSFVPLIFAAIRLARFNVSLKGYDKSFFQGLPSPAAAITIASFIIFNFFFWDTLRWHKVLLLLVFFVSILMVTTIRYEVMPQFSLRGGRTQRIKIVLALLGTLALVLFPHETFFPLAMLYVFSGPIYFLYRLLIVSDEQLIEKDYIDTEKG